MCLCVCLRLCVYAVSSARHTAHVSMCTPGPAPDTFAPQVVWRAKCLVGLRDAPATCLSRPRIVASAALSPARSSPGNQTRRPKPEAEKLTIPPPSMRDLISSRPSPLLPAVMVMLVNMKELAAYMLLVKGGNATPSAADVTKVVEAAGGEVDTDKLTTLLADMEGKDFNELLEAGREKHKGI